MGTFGSLRFQALEQRKRAAVLDAAAAEFAAHGYLAASTNRIAATAGVSKGALFSYFATKDLLFAGVLDSMFEQLQEHAKREHTTSSGDVFERLEALALTALEVHKRLPYLFALCSEVLYRAEGIPDRESYVSRYMAFTRDIASGLLDGARARGELTSDVTPAAALAIVDASMQRLHDMLVFSTLRQDNTSGPMDEACFRSLAAEVVAALRRTLATQH